MKKMLVGCFVLGISAGLFMSALQAGNVPVSKTQVPNSKNELTVQYLEENLKQAENKGDTKQVAYLKKCIEAKKAFDTAVKSGTIFEVEKASENLKKVMQENNGAVSTKASAKDIGTKK